MRVQTASSSSVSAAVLRVHERDVDGAVVDDVEPAEALDRDVDHALDARGVAHVHRDREAAAARGHDLGALEGDVGDDDARALCRHRDRAGPAHARAAADDERDLALEASAHGRSSRPSRSGCQGRYWPSLR